MCVLMDVLRIHRKACYTLKTLSLEYAMCIFNCYYANNVHVLKAELNLEKGMFLISARTKDNKNTF